MLRRQVAEDQAAGTPRGIDAGEVTLAGLLDALGPLVLSLVCAPGGLGRTVGEPVFFDRGEALPVESHGVLLAVGTPPQGHEILATLSEAAESGYAAVVVKARRAGIEAAAACAAEAGVALLLAPDDMPWRHLATLITTARQAKAVRSTYSSVGVGDLFALADAIALNIGGATTIEDPRGTVLAYSNLREQRIDPIRRQAILGRRTPARPTNGSEYETVCSADGPVRFYPQASDHMDRLAIAVRAGSQLLGLIWVLDDEHSLGPGAEGAIEEAARVAALHILKARRHRYPERWRRGEALTALLQGSISAQGAAELLGVEVTTAATLLGVEQAIRSGDRSWALVKTFDLVGLYCEAWYPPAHCAAIGEVVYVLVPSQAHTPEAVRVFAEELAESLSGSASLSVHLAIGVPLSSLDKLADGRRDVDRLLRTMAGERGNTAVASLAETWSRVRLLELAEEVDLGGGGPSLAQELAAHDRANSTDYCQTLLTYFESFGDAPEAARRLGIHENTLRYRLRRARALSGLDLDDPETRLVLWLQLRVAQIHGGALSQPTSGEQRFVGSQR